MKGNHSWLLKLNRSTAATWLTSAMLLSSTQAIAQTDAGAKPTAGTTSNFDYLDKVSDKGLSRWSKNAMPIGVFILEPDDKIAGYKPRFAQLLRDSFGQWSEVSKGNISFKFLDSAGGADIICTWTNDQKQMSSALEDGHAALAANDSGVIHADVIFLIRETPPSEKDAKRLFLHEIGHALGISGHSDSPQDIMYPTRDPQDRDSVLSDRDKNTILALYTRALNGPKLGGTGIVPNIQGTDNTSRALQLSNEAAVAMSANKPQEALAKLESAHKLAPDNVVVCGNLGIMYGNLAAMAGMTGQLPLAESLFQKAIPLLEKAANKPALAMVLTNYTAILKNTNRAAEASKYEARLTQLKSGK